MQDLNGRELDRWITGNWGADNDPETQMRQRGLSPEQIAEIMNGGPVVDRDENESETEVDPDAVPF